MRRRLDAWIVEDMVRALENDRDVCLVLNPSVRPQTGMPRVKGEDGKRRSLPRHLLYRTVGETAHSLLAACPTSGCMNPHHFEWSMRRSRPVRTHCPNGHEYTPENIEVHGDYRCKTCYQERLARNRKGEHGRGYCRHGHKLTKSNTYLYTTASGITRRKCRKCAVETMRAYRERKAMANG